MKGLQPEGAAGLAEKGAILAKADVAPIVIVEFVESLGQPRWRILERRGGEFASAVDNLLETKTRRLGARAAQTLRGLRENDARRAGRGDGAEHLAASECAHVAFLSDLSSRFVAARKLAYPPAPRKSHAARKVPLPSRLRASMQGGATSGRAGGFPSLP